MLYGKTTSSDASDNDSSALSYGQTGFITLILFINTNVPGIYNVVDLSSSKQIRVCYLSFGVQILVCTDANDRYFYLKDAMFSLDANRTIPRILHVYPKGLYDTATTFHEGRDYRLRQKAQLIRGSFESGEFDSFRWIQGMANIADALTKCNPRCT